MSTEPITLEGMVFLEDDGSWTAESFLTFKDGECLSKSVTGLASHKEAERAIEALFAEAEQTIQKVRHVCRQNNLLN